VAGLAFKGGTDDIRESPAIVLVQALLTRGAIVAVCDPAAERYARAVLRERVTFAPNIYEMCHGAQALVIANDDRRCTQLDWKRIAHALGAPNLVDLRNRIDRSGAEAAGLRYSGVGRARRKVAAS
jgi:UDPglucose 6-dehydrogenase